ncbi:MAG: SRPBCC family protein [Chloroflexota bacterium]
MRLGTEFRTNLDPARAFAYLSDFGSIEEWDPFIQRAERLDPGPPRIGSRYHLEGRLLGRSVGLDYQITEIDPMARRVKLVGSGGRAYDGWDEITITPADGGSTVRYDAEVRLHGGARLLVLLAPVGMILGGGRALAGMRRRLDEMASAPAA